MTCPLCKQRQVSELAALECERQNFRLVCSHCLAEALRPKARRQWPKLAMAPAVKIELVEAA